MAIDDRETFVSPGKGLDRPATNTNPALLPSKLHDQDSISNGTRGNPVDLDDTILRANGHSTAMPHQSSWMSALNPGFSITDS